MDRIVGGITIIVAGLALASAKSLLGKAAARLGNAEARRAPKGNSQPQMRTAEYYANWYLGGGLFTVGIGLVLLIIGLMTR